MNNMTSGSQHKIDTLHPKIRLVTAEALNAANVVLSTISEPIITQGLRTFLEQDALYLQKPKVTNAKGGQSIHNYGLAIDIALLINGKTVSWDEKRDWDGDKQADWMEVVRVFKKYGFKWGGDWRTFKDMPHFEMSFGLGWRDMLAKYKKGDFIEGTKYINI